MFNRKTAILIYAPDKPCAPNTLQQLDDIVGQVSDNEATRRVNAAQDKLFASFNST